mmetsp:Transcript_32394/g.28687  ORF Transcript_32394/g.28687 Transcript_32394/m.28687 type:complete len:199 (+) Transcript_32394:553-1149(+)
MFNQNKDIANAKKQLKTIGYGGLICAVIRVIRVISNYILIKFSTNYVCSQNLFFRPMNNTVAAILWMRLLANFIPSAILFYVIYFVPAHMGKITTHNNINIASSRSSSGEEDSEVSKLKETRDTFLLDTNRVTNNINGSVEDFNNRTSQTSREKKLTESDFGSMLLKSNQPRKETKVVSRRTDNTRKSMGGHRLSLDE